MKTNTLNSIIAIATLTSIALIAPKSGLAGNYELLPIIVSYGAVAILASLAMSDYRGGVKRYSIR